MLYSELDKYNALLSKSLKMDRYLHSVGVSYMAASLAMRYGYDPNKAQLAGLLHDYAKKDSSSTYIEYCNNHNIEISDAEYNNPGLLHAKIGAYLAKEKFNIYDEDILNAIKYHTTGHPDMTLLEKIIYISDYIEPGRYKQPNLDLIRDIVFKDIDKALLLILEDTVAYIKSNDYIIDNNTIDTLNFYKELINGRN